MDKYDQLEKIKKLLDEGVITQAEYDQEKNNILKTGAGGATEFWGMQEKEYCMFMHLSQLLGMIVPVIPFIGIIIPIVMWATAKDYSQTVDNQGKIIINWIISAIIYFIISLILIAVIIGIPLLVALMVVNVVFAIIGAIKARGGVEWEYPLSIPFFKRQDAIED